MVQHRWIVPKYIDFFVNENCKFIICFFHAETVFCVHKIYGLRQDMRDGAISFC